MSMFILEVSCEVFQEFLTLLLRLYCQEFPIIPIQRVQVVKIERSGG